MAILAQLESQVLAAKSDANPILQWQNWQFRRFAQQLYVITIPEAVPTQSIAWSVTDPLILPAKLGWLECSQAPESNEMTMQFDPTLGPLQVRFGGFSLRFAPSGRPHSKPLKQWFKEWQLAPWLRSQVVILVQQEKVIGVLVEGQWIVAQPITNNPACVITHRAFTA
jgi:tRNA(Ile)-lysidine synthase